MMIVSWEIVSVFVLRAGLVALFVPFSVAYMMIDFRGARDHAASAGVGQKVASIMTVAAIILKIIAAIGILTGIADRLAALVLAGFCVLTALLYKQFWRGDGLKFEATNANLPKLWDFLKNIALAAAFVLIGFGVDANSFGENVEAFLEAPFGSSEPYRLDAEP